MSNPCKHWFEGMVARSETMCPFCEIEQLRAEVQRLRDEAMMQAQYTQPDDVMFEKIERAARASYRHHQSSIRGQQLTRADSYESHLIWAAQQHVRSEAAKPDCRVCIRNEMCLTLNKGLIKCVNGSDFNEWAKIQLWRTE